MFNKNALFPLSMGNKIFATKKVLTPLQQIAENYDKIFFLIPNNLIVYNRLRKKKLQTNLSELLFEIPDKSSYEKYIVWVKKLEKKINGEQVQVDIENIILSDNQGKKYLECFRKLLLFFYSSKEFSKDIIDASNYYLERNKFTIDDFNIDLSKTFIIDELAASIIIKTTYEIFDEYYIGKSLKPIVKFYQNHYEIGINNFLYKEEKRNYNYYFFNYNSNSWEKCVYA